MRKYIIGIFVGALLVFGSQTLADSIVGKKIEGVARVNLNGVDLSTPAIVVEGISYAPIRAISESLGLEVGYVDGVVTLKSGEDPVEQIKNEIKAEIQLEQEINNLKNELSEKEEELLKLKDALKNVEDHLEVEVNPDVIASAKRTKSRLEESIRQIETRINEIKQRLSELEN